MSNNKYKTLLSNTLLISLGTFGSKILVFLMVRFYTGYLTPSDYGTADLITQTANLLFPLISLGITDGVFRFAIDHAKGRRSVFTVGIYTITFGSLLFIIIIPLLRLVPQFRGYMWLIVIFTMASCYHSLCAQFVRAVGNTTLFAIQGILNTAVVILLNILFLAAFHMGIVGYVLSVAVADILCTAFLVIKEKLWRQFTKTPRLAAFVQMLRYSIPLIPTTVFWWITSVSDRYMVNGFIGSEANGIYAISYKIPTIITLVSGIFMEAWQFSAVTELQGERKEHIRFYSKVWNSFQAIMFIAGAFIIAFSKVEIRVLSTESYYEAWKYVPVLTAAMVYSSFVTFMGSVYLVTKKSTLSFITAMAGALINIALNFILIPSPMGVQGAAVATLASYFVVFIIRSVNARKYIPFRLYTERLVINSIILIIQLVTMTLEIPAWKIVQAACIAVLMMLNFGPIWLGVKKIFNSVARRGTAG